jgi:hypothetical protein
MRNNQQMSLKTSALKFVKMIRMTFINLEGHFLQKQRIQCTFAPRMKNENQIIGKRAMLLAAGWITCCIIVFKVLGSFFQVAGPADDRLALSGGKSVFIHQNHSVPHFPSPTPLEPTIPGEVESKDECDDETGKLFSNLFLNSCKSLNTEKRFVSYLRLSFDNRSSVSLIILHHSWKSFLS